MNWNMERLQVPDVRVICMKKILAMTVKRCALVVLAGGNCVSSTKKWEKNIDVQQYCSEDWSLKRNCLAECSQ